MSGDFHEGVADPGAVVYLGLGGNLGDRAGNLRAGLLALAEQSGLQVIRVSRVYETEFVGEGRQDPYLNACAELRCTLAPVDLLTVLQQIEITQGRGPDTHLQPRPLDLDILLFDQLTGQDPKLSVPHPRMRERAFVLEPLAEIAATERFPDSGETVAEACAKIRRKPGPGVTLRPDLVLWPILSE